MSQDNLPPSMHSNNFMAKKNFRLNYDPDNNKNNIYARKLNKDVPETKKQFSHNPLTKMLQPIEVTKSKRFARDNLNISDIPGAQSDVYKKYRNLEGREYIDAGDIEGAKPTQLKQSKPMNGPDYKLYTKDINPDKWKSKRVVDPLKPEYEFPTRSGRLMRLGQIERSAPKLNISPQTKRFANYVDDIEGSKPKKSSAINEEQRYQATINSAQDLQVKAQISGRNTNPFGISPQKVQIDQMKILQESQSNIGSVPHSHYARFSTYQNLQQTAQFGNGLDQFQHLQQKQQPQAVNVNDIYSAQRQKYSSQIQMNNAQSHSQPTILGNQQNKSIRASMNDRLQSKRMNTFEQQDNKTAEINLLPNFSPANVYQNQKSDYLRTNIINGMPNQSNTIDVPNQSQMFDQSPEIKNRVWSKARVIGQEMNGQQNRINSSNSQQQNIVDRVNLKRNFNENIYQKGLLMNSGHKSFVSGVQHQQFNPLSNEVNKSVDNAMFNNRIPMRRDMRLASKLSQSIAAQNYQVEQSNVTKQLLPSTTSKVYGNFLDGKQIDQMISQLKNTNMNPII